MQGDPLSSLLFNSYLYDIYPIKVNTQEISGFLFADDLVLLAISRIHIHRKINLLNVYLKKLNLKINIAKTKCIIFRKGGKISKKEKIYVENNKIEIVTSYTYLGVPFSSKKFLCYAPRASIKKLELPWTAYGNHYLNWKYNQCTLSVCSLMPW